MDKKTFAVDIQMEALLFRVESKHGDKIQIENDHMLLEHEGCSMLLAEVLTICEA